MKRRILLAYLLALAIVTTSGGALAGIWVGKTEVTTGYETMKSLPNGKGSVQYKAGTLVLNGVVVEQVDNYTELMPSTNPQIASIAAGIYISQQDAVTIELVGKNTVTGMNSKLGTAEQLTVNNSYGVYSLAPLIFTGNGSLTANGGTGETSSFGIKADAMDIDVDGCEITAVAGAAGDVSVGMSCDGYSMSSGVVLVNSVGHNSNISAGLSCDEFYSNGGELLAVGGNARNQTYGIDCDSTVEIDAGHVTGGCGNVPGIDSRSCGIDCLDFIINGGRVDAIGNPGDDPDNLYGIGLNATDGAGGGSVTLGPGTTTAARGWAGAVRTPDFNLSGTWYEWKNSRSSPLTQDGAFTKSTLLPYTRNPADLFLYIRPADPDPVPATGDGANLTGLIALMLLAATSAALLLARRRRLG